MVRQIPLTRAAVAVVSAVVSDVDADLAAYSWFVSIESDRLSYGVRYYKDENRKRIRVRLHREIMERIVGRKLDSEEDVDHIDCNSLNNTRDNLRITTASQNLANRRLSKNNKSGYKGVSWHTGQQKWRACIRFHSKSIHLGVFTDKHEAARAYNAKARELQGQYARLNVIDESL